MITAPHYLLLSGLGLVMIAWGLPASHRLKTPWNSLAALLVLVGVGLLMLGALLAVLPDFFRE